MISLSQFFLGGGGEGGAGRGGGVLLHPVLYWIIILSCSLHACWMFGVKFQSCLDYLTYVSLITLSLPKRNHLIFRQLFIDARSSKLTPEGTKELVSPFLTRLNKRRDVFADEDGDIEKDSCTGE